MQVQKRKLKVFSSFAKLNPYLIQCQKCPRLVKYRETVPEAKRFQGCSHWRRPVPGFGDPKAWLLILGLAPSAQGGNRTGRIFTGDASAEFLFKALYQVKCAELPYSVHVQDGQKLKGCFLTAGVKCVPPSNLPSIKEMHNCAPYLWNEIKLLKNITCVLVLGRFALNAFLWYAKQEGKNVQGVRFQHGGKVKIDGLPELYMCYHPSPQNTNTGRLTLLNMIRFLERIWKDHNHSG